MRFAGYGRLACFYRRDVGFPLLNLAPFCLMVPTFPFLVEIAHSIVGRGVVGVAVEAR
jgi:hypothetical protein